MASTATHPRSFEDALVFYSLALTWPVYLIGGLYVLGPILAVSLTAIFGTRLYLKNSALPVQTVQPVPAGAWVWLIGMIFMLIALEIGHVNNNLGVGQTIKSTIGWAKGWSLLALFPLVGACLSIRLETLIHAAGWVAFGTLLVTPIFLIAPRVGLPEVLYVSPLKIVGGPGPEFFAVQLYSIEPTDRSTRLRYFTPWSPAAGMIGNMYLIFALVDKRRFWRWICIISALVMIVTSKSRLAIAAAFMIWPLVLALSEARRPSLWFLSGFGLFLLTPFAQPLIDFFDSTLSAVKSMRADSTRVREALGEIAVDRWWQEAPLFGHGIVERGPHLVEFMPIGSHHTWYGLLFVKGIVGVLALAIPMFWSFLEFAILTFAKSRAGMISFGMMALMIFYSVGENLEILAYLMWPGLIAMGIAMRETHSGLLKTSDVTAPQSKIQYA